MWNISLGDGLATTPVRVVMSRLQVLQLYPDIKIF
jgi:hypothetical protein